MIELALDDEPGMAASRLEADVVPSYSIHTIEKLKQQLSLDDRLFFLIGADAFAEIQTWKRWRDVANAVEFIVVSRPGHRYNLPEGVRVHRLDILDLPVSSSGIRERLAAGDDRIDAPPAVLRYIVERNLYSPQM
jgi:nicotinate-nucleotide adenylyltransferase